MRRRVVSRREGRGAAFRCSDAKDINSHWQLLALQLWNIWRERRNETEFALLSYLNVTKRLLDNNTDRNAIEVATGQKILPLHVSVKFVTGILLPSPPFLSKHMQNLHIIHRLRRYRSQNDRMLQAAHLFPFINRSLERVQVSPPNDIRMTRSAVPAVLMICVSFSACS
jgi:hypothetical protein